MKKWISFLLCLCLMAPILPAQAAQTPPAWAEEAYAALETRQVFLYLPPSGSIDRGAFTDLLVALLNSSVPQRELEQYPTAPADYFSDTTLLSHLQAAGYGILEGTVGSDGLRRLNPGDLLTREQAAKMVCSLLDFFSQKLGHTITPSGQSAVYADADTISSWALPYTQQIAAYGLMQGDDQGNFGPLGTLDWPSAVVLASRILSLLDEALNAEQNALPLHSQLSPYFSISGLERFLYQPWYPRPNHFYTIVNEDDTVSLLAEGADQATVEHFDQAGTLISSQVIPYELPIFGAFLEGTDGYFYLAFGQDNTEEDDDKEVWRIVKYDREWNRVASASVSGGDSYTTLPFFSTANTEMTLSDKGELCLHTARQRYLTPDDGLRHQSNITITVDSKDMSVLSVSSQFPANHVSHSFSQHARYDGEKLITVDRGDMYPRSFLLQADREEVTLMKFAQRPSQTYQITNSIGGGLEVSDSGYLFLGCSDPQEESEGQPWNVFLAYTPKGSKTPTLTWLTSETQSIQRSKLVKLGGDSFVALWQQGDDVHYQKLDGKGQKVGQEETLAGVQLPPSQPVVMDDQLCWIQYSSLRKGFFLYRLEL